MPRIMQAIKKIRASHILAGIFVLSIFYVGTGYIPFLKENLSTFVYGNSTLGGFIDEMDFDYALSLETGNDPFDFRKKGLYINFNGAMAKLLNQRDCNYIVKLKNGHLTLFDETPVDADLVSQVADNLKKLSDAQSERNGTFLFVLAPNQFCQYEQLLPPGYTDTTNEAADLLLDKLMSAGINCLDLRDAIHAAGFEHTDMFFKTDNHWIPQAGFWAYGRLLEELERIGAIGKIDPFYTDWEQFEIHRYEDCFLGTSGRRTGIYYGGLDDFTLIVPKFDTDISVKFQHIDGELRGRFEDVCNYNPPASDFKSKDYFNTNHYAVYGYNDFGFAQRRNEYAPEDKKMTLIGDSFTNIPYSFLSLYVTQTDELDMRYYTGDFAEYYQSFAPDVVVILVNPSELLGLNTTYPYVGE